MARSLLAALLLTFAVSSSSAADSPVGTWEGEVRTSRWPMFMTLNLSDRSASSLVLLGRTIPVDELTIDGETVKVSTMNGALVLEGRVTNGRLLGTLREGTAALPFEFDRVPQLAAPKDRVERWSQDLDALATRFIRYDRSFSGGERALFLERLDSIRTELPKLDDATIMMRIASAISIADNAHTRLYLLRNRTEMRRLPIRLWWFRDGLYVVRATPEHKSLLGCRVLDIEGTDVRQARDLVSMAFAGNPSWRDYKSVYFMTSPEALRGAGIVRDMESIDIGVANCASVSRASVKPLPLLKKTTAVEAWWDLTPLHADADRTWAHALDGSKNALPLYLRNPMQPYWFDFDAASGVLYFHYNRSAEAGPEKMSDFAARLLAQFDTNKVNAVVVDLRFNTGGNLGIARKLLEDLLARSSGIAKFVITGRATFSAGISAAASWRKPGVTFIGEPVGDDLDMWAEGGNIILPNSGLAAHFANGAHSYSEAPCPKDAPCLDMSSPSLGPDIAASSSWNEYAAGRDVAMEAVMRQVRAAK